MLLPEPRLHCALLALGLLAPRLAIAEPARPSIQIEVEPSRCFDAAASEALRRDAALLQPENDVQVLVTQRDGVLLFTVKSADGAVGSRSIDTNEAECSDVVRAAQLTLSVTLADIGIAPVSISSRETEIPAVAPPSAPIASDEPLPAAAEASSEAAHPGVPLAAPEKQGGLRVGASLDVGVGFALTGVASVVTSAAGDVGYAPNSSIAPEVSGRAGLFMSLPSQSMVSEHEVWLSLYASRLDGCAGLLSTGMRLRACGSALIGGLVASGAESSSMVAIGGRLEGTWRATDKVGILLAGDVLSMVYPRSIRPEVELWEPATRESLSTFSLAFSTGVIAAFL